MKALAVFPEKEELRVIGDHSMPELTSPHDVKVRMLEVGVCATDREICSFEYGAPPQGFDHLVLGHEGLGEVVEVGSAVSTLQPKDLVVPMVRRPCNDPECYSCREDRSDFCYNGNFVERGIKECHGFMTDYVVDHEKFLCKVPPELRDVAVLIEPLTVAEKALEQIWQVQQRLPWTNPEAPNEQGQHRAVVLGAGPVGIMGAMAFKVAGFDTYVFSRSPAPNPKANLIESFGVPYISCKTTSVEEMARQVGRIDVVYEAIGVADISFKVLDHLAHNGIFVFTGIPGYDPPIELDAAKLMRNIVLKNQAVIGTVNASRKTFQDAIRDLGTFMEQWPEAVRAIISGRYAVEDANELLMGKATGIKNVISLTGKPAEA